MASRETIARMFALMATNWPEREISKNAMAMYERVLEDLPDEAVEAAVLERIGGASPFFPRAGELRTAALALAAGTGDLPPALVVWGKLMRYARRYSIRLTYGPRSEVPPLPHLVQQCADALGGVVALGESQNEAADRARFCQVYDQLVARRQRETAMLPAVREARALLREKRVERIEAGA